MKGEHHTHHITELGQRWKHDGSEVAEEIFSLVYTELERLASHDGG